MDNSFSKTSEEVLKNFNVTIANGLNSKQVKENTEKYGKNGIYHELFYIIINF